MHAKLTMFTRQNEQSNNDQINQEYYTHSMRHYSTTEINEILVHATV